MYVGKVAGLIRSRGSLTLIEKDHLPFCQASRSVCYFVVVVEMALASGSNRESINWSPDQLASAIGRSEEHTSELQSR